MKVGPASEIRLRGHSLSSPLHRIAKADPRPLQVKPGPEEKLKVRLPDRTRRRMFMYMLRVTNPVKPETTETRFGKKTQDYVRIADT